METTNLFIVLLSLCYASAFIIPNELPTILSLVYSNIPPLKIGQDTRFGIGFRLGPHADFQTLIEIGPQSNTGQLAQDGPAKRDSVNQQDANQKQTPNPPIELPIPEAGAVEEEKKKRIPPKKTNSPFMEKIVFKKVPGIDDR